jgi:hypothetical protein
MRELNFTNNEKEFFNQLKRFLLDTKLSYPSFDIVSFYQALVENKTELELVIDYCEGKTEFKYMPTDQYGFDVPQYADTIKIQPTFFNGSFTVELSNTLERQLHITKHETFTSDYFILDEEYSEELAAEWKDDLKEYRKNEAKKEIEKLEQEIADLNSKKQKLLKEVV